MRILIEVVERPLVLHAATIYFDLIDMGFFYLGHIQSVARVVLTKRLPPISFKRVRQRARQLAVGASA